MGLARSLDLGEENPDSDLTFDNERFAPRTETSIP